MEQRKRVLTVGATAVTLAVLVRLILLGPMADLLGSGGALSLMVYLQTGRVVRWTTPAATAPPYPTAPSIPAGAQTEPAPTLPPETAPPEALPVFSQVDAENVEVNDLVGYAPALGTLLETPIRWQLRQESPTVLIVHTHATESYTQESWETYEESGICRTLDLDYNMVSIGAALAEHLRAGGISVIHDRTLHDHPSYNGAYNHARASIARYLEEYPSITMVIDLHRDALEEDGPRLTLLGDVDGEEAAQLMVVAGSDKNLEYPGWKDNLSLGVQLTALLERENPGITRPVQLRAQRFNLDMTPGSLLIEVGGNGNTHTQALRAVEALAQGLLALAGGTNS